MHDLFHIHFFNDDEDSVVPSDDDVDQLFLQLEQVVPPRALVGTILASVARLPSHKFLPDADEAHKSRDEFGILVVPNSRLQPS